jgi:hypothetical protein
VPPQRPARLLRGSILRANLGRARFIGHGGYYEASDWDWSITHERRGLRADLHTLQSVVT